ncbi:10768_t:CDS:1 [Gigaspora margarita]|uniref:10768_t:CDS:1 n=1 Tax=Gigaspora margarita TaxID=4874 RepID=A0ABN7VJZ6_GIGMA|nr:10768_t:CDS:1 [Gigaspora margarita]
MEDTKYLLSIDGGGIRGIIPAIILAELEKRVTEELKKENPNADFRCADFFDILAGTSTGSILVSSLAVPGDNNRPKYSGSFMVDFFHQHGNDVFPNYSPFGYIDNLLKNVANVHKGAKLSNMTNSVVGVVKETSLKAETKIRSITDNESSVKVEKKGFVGTIMGFFSHNKEQNNEINDRVVDETDSKVEESASKIKTVDVKKSNTEDGTTSKTEIVNTEVTTTDVTMNKEEDDESLMEHLKELDDYLKTYDPFKPRYDGVGFEKLLSEYLYEFKLKDTVNGVNVFITSYNISNGERTFFTNLNSEHEDILLKDAIRASASAPTYFPAKNISNKYFVDGGVFMNNPTSRAYLEARKKYPNSKFIVISLGTGRYLKPLEKYHDAGIAQWASPLISVLMDSEQLNHHDTMKILAELDGTKYYRIQPILEEKVNLASVSENDVKKLIDIGNKAISDTENKLDEIINLLVDKCKKNKH